MICEPRWLSHPGLRQVSLRRRPAACLRYVYGLEKAVVSYFLAIAGAAASKACRVRAAADNRQGASLCSLTGLALRVFSYIGARGLA